MSRHRVTLDYGIEMWPRDDGLARWAVRILAEAVFWVGAILAGMGLAWILTALHGAGWR